MSSSSDDGVCGNVIYLNKTIKVLRTFDKSLWFFWIDSVIGNTKSSNKSASGSGYPTTSVYNPPSSSDTGGTTTGSSSTTTNPVTASTSTVENNNNTDNEGIPSGETHDQAVSREQEEADQEGGDKL